MPTSVEQLEAWMAAPREDEHLEFKEAKTQYDFDKLGKYCAALANEGGGKMVLGVTNKRPRRVVGSQAFRDPDKTKTGLMRELYLRIDAEVLLHPGGRVVIFHVPARHLGLPVRYKGVYWMRRGEEVVPMSPDMLRHIFDETGPDFSAQTCSEAHFKDLDPKAIDRLRSMWRRKSGNAALDALLREQLLADAELIVDNGVTYAALILLGTHKALGRLLAQAEVVFEYRSSDASVHYQKRKEFREGFFLFQGDLWETINERNDVHHYQDGLFVWDIPTFNEMVVREAILNAVSHRDYRLPGSVFVRQFARRLEVESPGGFPPGITVENILFNQFPRNRRIAEVFDRCGLVERSGQGVRRMFEESIKESKARPDYSGSDDYLVKLTLAGEVQDTRFLRFLEQVGQETLASFTTEDFLVLDVLRRGERVPRELAHRINRLVECQVVETQEGRRGYMLSKRAYSYLGERGVYTRRRGLDRETNKALILQHLDNYKRATIRDLEQIFQPIGLSRGQIHHLLRVLRDEGKVECVGKKRGSAWVAK